MRTGFHTHDMPAIRQRSFIIAYDVIKEKSIVHKNLVLHLKRTACRKTFGFPPVFSFVRFALFTDSLKTAQNCKVWAARAKPVLPTDYILLLF